EDIRSSTALDRSNGILCQILAVVKSTPYSDFHVVTRAAAKNFAENVTLAASARSHSATRLPDSQTAATHSVLLKLSPCVQNISLSGAMDLCYLPEVASVSCAQPAAIGKSNQ